MLFNSFIFFIFLAVVIPLFYALPSKKSKNSFLLIASYTFYAFWDWRFCFLLLFSTSIDFFIGQYLYKSTVTKTKKRLLFFSVFVNLTVLGFFKYFNFFIDSFKEFSSLFGYEFYGYSLNIILPVGISFYTFQSLSYTIDIYRKQLKPTVNFIDFALFVSFFPQLVAGPIERAKNLLPQLAQKLHPSKLQVQEGVVLIVTGLFRKVLIGDTAGRYVDHMFGNIDNYKSFELIAALVLFSIQIYADFSGYSRIARGTAKLLGVELMKNFNQPYFAQNISDFWKRWHISLSSWLKDYLYIPLGGNRNGSYKMYRNILLTMLLGGLWHGASWNFVIWGALHGLYLIVYKLISKQKGSNSITKKFTIKVLFNILITYILVLVTWLFFRISSFDEAILFFSKLYYWEASELTARLIVVLSSYILVIFGIDLLEYKTNSHTFILKLRSRPLQYGILAALFFVVILYMIQSDNQPFIYFQF